MTKKQTIQRQLKAYQNYLQNPTKLYSDSVKRLINRGADLSKATRPFVSKVSKKTKRTKSIQSKKSSIQSKPVKKSTISKPVIQPRKKTGKYGKKRYRDSQGRFSKKPVKVKKRLPTPPKQPTPQSRSTITPIAIDIHLNGTNKLLNFLRIPTPQPAVMDKYIQCFVFLYYAQEKIPAFYSSFLAKISNYQACIDDILSKQAKAGHIVGASIKWMYIE